MKNIKSILLAAFILVNLSSGFAATPPPSGSPSCWPPPCVPVDNGVIFLIIAGGLYGIKKIYDLRKKPNPFLNRQGIMKATLKSNAFVRFIASAGLIYLLLYLLYQFGIKRYTHYDQKFIGTIIQAADMVLHALGYQTFKILQDHDMQVIGIDGSNGVWVGSNCNAITLFTLFSVFIIAYPGYQKAKLWYVPAGILAIHLLNILRVVALALIANYAPQYLDFNHTYTFTFIIYAFIFGLWMTWVNKFSARTTQS